MTYTILSAAYANVEQTTAILQTEEAGAVLVSEADTPDAWAAMLAWGGAEDYIEPAAPRRALRKSIVQQRLIDAGLMNAAYVALSGNAAYFARWFAPDRPEVYADDPDALLLLASIGADAAVIMAPEA